MNRRTLKDLIKAKNRAFFTEVFECSGKENPRILQSTEMFQCLERRLERIVGSG